jgi:ABC-type lipopolysaccharide export system ATPase subunit
MRVKNSQKPGDRVSVDFVLHPVGSFEIPGYTGPNGAGSVQTRSDFRGFLLSNVGQLDADSYPNAPPLR